MQCSNSLRFRAIVWYCMHGIVLFSWLYLSKCDLAYVHVRNINHKKISLLFKLKGSLPVSFWQSIAMVISVSRCLTPCKFISFQVFYKGWHILSPRSRDLGKRRLLHFIVHDVYILYLFVWFYPI